MDIVTFLYYLFGITSTSYILHLGYYLVSASIYDIWQLRRTHSYTKVQTESGATYQPSVTVLIPAHNEEKVIVRCLDSVIASTYPDV